MVLSITSLIARGSPLSELNSEDKNQVIVYAAHDAESDTTVLTIEGDSVSIPVSGGDSLNISLKESSIKDDLLDILFGAIFRDTSNAKYRYESNLTESEEKYFPYKGQIIDNIYISKVPVFGGSVDDTVEFTITDIEEFGNSLHINSKDWVIKNNLLFAEGDEVKPFELADNERILRRLSFIRDARILIFPGAEDDKVDVLVITRDVFSLGFSINANAVDDIAISIFDRNLFGNGWNFRNTFRYRSEFEQKVDYEGIFDINNIQGSFIGMTLKYIYAHDQQQGWMRLYKDYLTPETRYAGGIDFIRTTLKDELQEFKTITQISNTYDFWLGRSFLLGGEESRRTIKVGARYFRKTFDERPIVLADSNFSYHNQKLYLANIMFDKREYFTSSMIYGFGITEDVPTGYFYELTGGFSDEEFKNRPYVGLDARIASWFDDIGYMALGTQAATYINNGRSEDGLINISYQYFSPLIESGRYGFRHFLFANYVTGINRFDDRLIDIRDQNGIRGLSNDRMDGMERLIFNLESVAFTPWNLIGFQFSMYTFADLGWISPDKGIFNETNFSSAIGIGCRIRNEGLVFQTLNLRIAYFPSVPSGENHFGYDISTTDPVFFPRFSPGKPRILPFK